MQSLRDRKNRSRCKKCGQRGHWASDPECPGTFDGEEIHGVRADEGAWEPLVDQDIEVRESEVCVNCSLGTQENNQVAGQHRDSGFATVDPACGLSCGGMEWIDDYVQRCRGVGCEDEIQESPGGLVFRFGDGRTAQSVQSYRKPCAPFDFR